jgi:LmbE family N-acetylglucosaminyl deacetylase
MKKIIMALLVATTILLSPLVALAGNNSTEDYIDITNECVWVTESNSDSITDDYLKTRYRGEDESIKIITPQNAADLQGIYIRWETYGNWTLTADIVNIPFANSIEIASSNGEQWKTEYIEIPSGYNYLTNFTLTINGIFSICDISVYDVGIPFYVPQWEVWDGEPIDVIVYSTHNDDEVIFFAPIIILPSDRDMSVITVFMTTKYYRTIESQECLWTMGEKLYPVSRDSGSMKKSVAMEYIVTQLDKYNPRMVFTHDTNGEYGKDTHKLTSKYVIEAVTTTDNTVDELYIHLYKNNSFKFDIDIPLESFDNQTVYEIAVKAFSRHKSQQTGRESRVWTVKAYDHAWSMNDWGLYYKDYGVLGIDELMK